MARIPILSTAVTAAVLATCTLHAQVMNEGPVQPHVHVQQTEGTRKMVQLLKESAQQCNNYRNIVANAARVKFFEELTKSASENEPSLYQEMVFAGMTEEAIDGLQKMLARPGLPPVVRLRVQKILGIAYLRQAEQDNCVVNHTAQSCLLPIQEGGFHTIQRGSRKAIETYSAILREQPNDVKSRWLLNIAYMTLGEYPDKVPAEWLYPESIFRSDYNLPRFTDIAPALGLDKSRLSGGAALEDFDRDGDLDIMETSWGVNDQMQYFVNNGDGTFSERTVEAGLEGITGGLNMFHADYNNDGFPDVFITRGAWMGTFGNQPNSLLRNNGDGTFSDVTIEAGMLSFRPTEAAAWGDFDNDGFLDLFIGNETTIQPQPCEFYHNNGDGTFTDIAHETGLDFQSMVKAVVWGDYNNDGLIDLYISSIGSENRLMKNNGKKNGKWSFTDVAKKAGVDGPIFSFPAFFFDYDNDGWLDIFVSDFGGQPRGSINGLPAAMNVVEPVVNDYLGNPPIVTVPRLYHNNGNGTFTDVAKEMHLDKTMFGMGCNYGDLDNDGWLDIYIGTGHPDLDALIPNRMFRNAEGRVFQDVTTSGGFGHLQKGHGIAFGDIDNDGDQDIFEVLGGAFEADVARMALFQNPGNQNHWVTLSLIGTKANRMGTGARIAVAVQRPDGSARNIYALAGTGGSFGSSSLQQEIGLGDAARITSITIEWPGSHTRQTVKNVEMDHTIAITEGSGDAVIADHRLITMPAQSSTAGHMHEHGSHGHEHPKQDNGTMPMQGGAAQ